MTQGGLNQATHIATTLIKARLANIEHQQAQQTNISEALEEQILSEFAAQGTTHAPPPVYQPIY